MNDYEQIVSVIAKQLQIDVSKIRPDTLIVEELGADSLDIIEILMELENLYSISVPDEIIVNFKTPSDILVYLQEIQNK